MSDFVNESVVQETRKHFYQKIFDTNFVWINNGEILHWENSFPRYDFQMSGACGV